MPNIQPQERSILLRQEERGRAAVGLIDDPQAVRAVPEMAASTTVPQFLLVVVDGSAARD